jgi:hypothetical protein
MLMQLAHAGFHAVPMMGSRSQRVTSQLRVLGAVLSATRAGESPFRRGSYSTRKLPPETRWTAASNALTVVPWPVPKFKRRFQVETDRSWNLGPEDLQAVKATNEAAISPQDATPRGATIVVKIIVE